MQCQDHSNHLQPSDQTVLLYLYIAHSPETVVSLRYPTKWGQVYSFYMGDFPVKHKMENFFTNYFGFLLDFNIIKAEPFTSNKHTLHYIRFLIFIYMYADQSHNSITHHDDRQQKRSSSYNLYVVGTLNSHIFILYTQ